LEITSFKVVVKNTTVVLKRTVRRRLIHPGSCWSPRPRSPGYTTASRPPQTESASKKL